MVSDARAGSLLRDYRFWLLLLLATLLRCWDLAHRSLSVDESYSLMLSQQPVGDIPYWTGLDVHPPLYYLLLHLWLTVFGHSVTAARLLSAVPGVITVFVQAWLMSLLAGRRAALLAALLLASWLALSLSGLVRVYGDGELFNGPSPAQVRVDALNAHIRQHFRAGDRVMTDDTYLWFTLQAYAPAPVGVWHADVDTATGMLIDSQGMDIRTLATLPRSVCRFWFASHPDTPMEDPQLDHQWQMTEHVDFGNDAVWLFVRQPVADTCEGE